MNNELTRVLTERIELLSAQSINPNDTRTEDEFIVVAAPEEEVYEWEDSEQEAESVLVDFDFDFEEKTDFDVLMTLKYFWKDWNPLYTEVY